MEASSSSRTKPSKRSFAISEKKKVPASSAGTKRKKANEAQRRRNVESARKSRDRLKHEEKWMMVQVLYNSDRIDRFEEDVAKLSAEVRRIQADESKEMSLDSKETRPSWFGQPF